ncbi:Uma2 family endonuclease [bacterium 1XD42-1]|nr:Uma2 family endonuclease [bacterium 1XD42-8]RKJ61835.1 Uma2 family endonuclease [bacterium 1XD42-1]
MTGNLAYQYEDEIWDEMIDGKIVAMSPRPAVNHNIISGNIYHIFKTYLSGKKCVPFGDGTDLYLTPKDRFVPDGMIVCNRDKIKPKGVYGAPDLVIEVLSPSTAKNDRGYKKRVYGTCGIPEYWIVSPSEKAVYVYLLQDGQYNLDNVYSLYPDYMLTKMTEEEQAAIPTEFQCSLFSDLVIRLENIFEDTL